jgi:hypothetical protein
MPFNDKKVGAEEFAGYYTEAAGAASAEDTLEAVNKLNEYLKREEAARLSALEEAHIKRLRQGQNNALEGFRAAA